jgi:ankyrin repeat protein
MRHAVLAFIILFSANVFADRIHEVSERGDIAQVQTLLSGGVRVDAKDDVGKTPLHSAALGGHENLVAYLLDHGADINAKNNLGVTPLMLAEYRNHYDLARWLILHGADPNVQAPDESTVLSEAWKKKQWDFVRFLFLHGVDPDAPIKRMFREPRPLSAAASEGEYEMVEWLLRQHVDINAKNDHWAGYSALHEAVRVGGKQNIVQLLLKHGADVNSRNADGVTPLHTAVAVQDLDMMRLLIENGADVNAQSTPREYDKEWLTPLTLAQSLAKKSRRTDDPIVALLLQKGAVLPSKTQEGVKPRSSPCHSESYIRSLNNFRSSDMLARYTGRDARIFVEAVFF